MYGPVRLDWVFGAGEGGEGFFVEGGPAGAEVVGFALEVDHVEFAYCWLIEGFDGCA